MDAAAGGSISPRATPSLSGVLHRPPLSLSMEAVAQRGAWRPGWWRTIRGMPQNFLACDREQVFLMPPDVREWLPEGHLAWFVVDAVG